MQSASVEHEDWINLRTRDFDTLLNEMIEEISGGQPSLLTAGQLHMLNVAARVSVEHYRPLVDYVKTLKREK